MFENILFSQKYDKIIVLPYNSTRKNELEALFIPNNIMLILIIKEDSKCLPKLHHLENQKNIDNYDLICRAYTNVYYIYYDYSDLDFIGLLMGYLSVINIKMYIDCDISWKRYLPLITETFKSYQIGILYQALFQSNINPDYLRLQQELLTPRNLSYIAANYQNAAMYLSRMLMGRQLQFLNGKYSAKSHKYRSFIVDNFPIESSLVPKEEYPKELKDFDTFLTMNSVQNQSSLEIKIFKSKHGLFTCTAHLRFMSINSTISQSPGLEMVASLCKAYYFELMKKCYLKFQYFKGIHLYEMGKLNESHDQALFAQCRKLISTNDSFFEKHKYVSFANLFVNKTSSGKITFDFHASKYWLNQFYAKINIKSLDYEKTSPDFNSKDECKQYLCKSFCEKYGVLKYLFEQKQMLVLKADIGEITKEELKEWIYELPPAVYEITKEFKKAKTSEMLLLKLVQSKRKAAINVEPNVWATKLSKLTNAASITSDKIEGTKWNGQKDVENRWGDQNLPNCNKQTSTPLKIDFRKPVHAPPKKLGFSSRMSKIEIGLLYKVNMVKSPRNYTTDYSRLNHGSTQTKSNFSNNDFRTCFKLNIANKSLV